MHSLWCASATQNRPCDCATGGEGAPVPSAASDGVVYHDKRCPVWSGGVCDFEGCVQVEESPLERARRLGGVDEELVGDMLRRPMIFGVPVITDPSIPTDEMHFKQGDRTVGKIVGISAPEPSECSGLEYTFTAYDDAGPWPPRRVTFWPGFSRGEIAEAVILAAGIAALLLRVLWLLFTTGGTP